MNSEERAAHWRQYRATRAKVWAVFFSGPFVVMAATIGLYSFVSSAIPFYLFSFAWMGLYAYYGLRMIWV